MVAFHNKQSRRVDPEIVEVLHREHLDRYDFASDHCREKRVLEIGCGFGYGAAKLAEVAEKVDAIDIYRPAVKHAGQHYDEPNLCFHQMDGCELDFGDESFDTVVSFEVIEHVETPRAFLKNIRRVLKTGGTAIISTPNGDLTLQDGKTSDLTHLREYRAEEFDGELKDAGFTDLNILGQELSQGLWQVHQLSANASRLDILRLRKFLPGAWKRRLLGLLVRLRFAKSAKSMARSVIKRDTSSAHVLLAVCRKVNFDNTSSQSLAVTPKS